jgi:glutaredoxin
MFFKKVKLKKIFFSFFIFIFFFSFLGSFVNAEKNEMKNTETVEINIFTSSTCPHCAEAKKYLNKLKKEKGDEIVVNEYSLSNNVDKAKEFYKSHDVPQNIWGLVPMMFIGDKYFLGFGEKTSEEINYCVENLQKNICAVSPEENDNKKDIIKLPIIGEINLLDFSLPFLAVIMGLIDGFNVCSLGALVVILGLVIVLKSRKRIFILGGSFVLTTALVYGCLIFLWRQFFVFIAPFMRSLEMLIGILAILGGLYLLKEFYRALKRGPVCSTNNILSRLAPRVEKAFKNKTNWFVLIGIIIIFSTIVTIIEFPCSAVMPMLFTGILVEAGVSFKLSLLYIAFFVLAYLLDEIIIFLIAVFTLKIKIVSPKFITFLNLLGAVIFIFLGLYYLL